MALAELEPAARAVLAVDPGYAQARHNLEVLLRTTGQWPEGGVGPPSESTGNAGT